MWIQLRVVYFSPQNLILFNNELNAVFPSNFPLVIRQGSSKATKPSSADDVSQHFVAFRPFKTSLRRLYKSLDFKRPKSHETPTVIDTDHR